MNREATAITTPATLLEKLVERSRLSWLQLAIIVELVLILILVGAVYLDGVPFYPLNIDFWRVSLVWPAIIAYALLTGPFSKRLRDGAIEAFRPLVPLEDDDFQRLLTEASLFNRRRECLAFGIGAGSILLVSIATPVRMSATGSGWSLTIYRLLGAGLMCGLLGLGIYASMSGTKLLTELSRYPLSVSVYDLSSLEPIARWSLGTTVTFIGGITLSMLFLPREALLQIEIIIVIYAPLTLTAVLGFFLNMASVHGDMVEAKKRELRKVRDNLMALSQALDERAAQGQLADAGTLLDSIKAWTAHEEWIRGLPEWPYTAAIKRNLALSLFLPVIVAFIREALAGLLKDSFPLR